MQHELRPLDKMNQYADLRAADLIQFAADFARVDNQIFRICPTCGESHASLAFDKQGFAFVRCGSCMSVYVNPVPSPAMLSHYYDGFESMQYFHQEVLAQTLERRRRIFSDRADMLAPFVIPGGHVLEVGSSIGLFLEQALARKWNITGVEVNEALVQRTRRELGANVIQGFVEQVRLPEHIDMAVMWEVLEHLVEPIVVLKKLSQLMGPHGRIAVTVPNYNGIEYSACGSDHEMVEAPGHLNYFTPENIEQLFARSGFKVIELQTPGVLDFTNIIQEMRRCKQPVGMGDKFLTRLVDSISEADSKALDGLMTQLIQKNKLSGHMFIVAQRA